MQGGTAMKNTLIALLSACIGSPGLAQETPADEEGLAEAEGDEGLIESADEPGGALVGVGLAFAKATGDLGDDIGLGIGGDVWGGYEIRTGSVGLIPRLKVGYENFLEKNGDGASMITVYPGFLVAVHVGKVVPWTGLGLGLGSLATDFRGGGTDRNNEFGIEWSVGLNYELGDIAAVGGFFAYDAIFTPAHASKVILLGASTQFRF